MNKEIENFIKDCVEKQRLFIVCGHRNVGKTAFVEALTERYNDKFEVAFIEPHETKRVYFSIEELKDMYKGIDKL